jgi:TRAP-type mannitol/chloroaromatic compound transport system substrate-binding protein
MERILPHTGGEAHDETLVCRVRARIDWEKVMDRRSFIVNSGVAAAAVSTVGLSAEHAAAAPQDTAAVAAPAIISTARELSFGSTVRFGQGPVGIAAERLARRIDTASAGRLRIVVQAISESALTSVMTGETDLAFGTDHHNLGYHRAFAYFAGLPFYSGLDPDAYQAWLTVGGGQLLWDDLAADFNVKPLLAGHTGRHPGLWLTRDIDTVAAFKGRTFAVPGLARDVVRHLGGEALAVPVMELAAALADGRIVGAEAGVFHGMMSGLHAAAKVHVGQGINNSGSTYAINVRRTLWEQLSAADQAVLEACAAEATREMLAETTALNPVARAALSQEHGVAFEHFSGEVIGALSRAADDVVAVVASTDAKARRIDDSFMAFREQMTGLGRRSPGPVA